MPDSSSWGYCKSMNVIQQQKYKKVINEDCDCIWLLKRSTVDRSSKESQFSRVKCFRSNFVPYFSSIWVCRRSYMTLDDYSWNDPLRFVSSDTILRDCFSKNLKNPCSNVQGFWVFRAAVYLIRKVVYTVACDGIRFLV